MANAFENPQQVVNLGVGLLDRKAVISNRFQRLGLRSFPFQDGKGRSVDFTLPTRLSPAREYALDNNRAQPIVIDELTEYIASVRLSTHLYKAIAVTDEQLTFDITDYGTRVLDPMTDVLVAGAEAKVAAALAAAPAKYRVSFAAAGGDPFKVANAASAVQTADGVPLDGRQWIVGSAVGGAIAGNATFQRMQSTGSDALLRTGTIGTINGYEVVVSNAVAPTFSRFAHPTALGIVNVAPAVPKGAYAGSTTETNGWAVRWLYDYDAPFLRDRTILSLFMGVISINDDQNADGTQSGKNARIVEVDFTADPDDDTAAVANA